MRFEPLKSNGTRWLNAFGVGLLLLALGIAWLAVRPVWGMLTLEYQVAPASVRINFSPSVIDIPRDEILQIRIEAEPSRLRRVAGTNMPGVYQGRWTSDQTGPITLYATSRKTLVVIETANRRFGISPADPESFVAAVESGTPGRFSPTQASAPWGLAALSLIPIFIALAMVIVFWVFRRIAERMAYELTADALLIHGPSRPITIPYADIANIRLENPKGIPYQSGGVAMPGFYWGSCSLKGVGRNLRLHATQLRPLVVFERGRSTFGISPSDPEAFLTELKKRLPRQ